MIDGNLLKSKIVAKGMCQRSVAKEIGMSENSFSAKIQGRSSFTVDEAIRICDLLDITEPGEKCNIFLPKASQ